MASKLAMTVQDVEHKYPQFRTDRLKYEKTVIKESLQWRIDHPHSKSFSCRADSIRRYFTYLDAEAVRTVQCAFRNKFYSHKDDTDYAKYWNEPALKDGIFADLDKSSNALTRILIDLDTPDGLVAREGIVPANIKNSVEIEFGKLSFTGQLKSEDHFYAIIDAIRNY